MCVGLPAGVVEGFRRRERKSLHGREDREKGFMVARREVIVWIGRDIFSDFLVFFLVLGVGWSVGWLVSVWFDLFWGLIEGDYLVSIEGVVWMVIGYSVYLIVFNCRVL